MIEMITRRSWRGAAAVALTIGALTLAACSSSGGVGSAPAGSAPASTTPTSTPGGAGSATSSAAVLQTASSDVGTIVVDEKQMTAYVYDKDTPNSGKSSCTGPCATAWPEVTTDSATPAVSGISGKVGTITGVDGRSQVTINGWPLYTYAQDTAAGATTGQGVGGVWWVVGADGTKITKTAAASSGGY